MDDIEDLVSVVNQTDVPADDDVPVVSRAGRQALQKFLGYRMDPVTQVPIEDFTLPKSWFEFRGQPVAVSEPLGEAVMMFGVPATRDLTVMVVEPPVVAISVALVFPVVLAFPSKSLARSDG